MECTQGAVMFLVEGPHGRVLHTGDFRWEAAAQADTDWHPALVAAPLDLLFLDNTYCHPRWPAWCNLLVHNCCPACGPVIGGLTSWAPPRRKTGVVSINDH